MAEKGGKGTDIFKLTVKVDLIGKSNANKKLQKGFQGDIVSLRQHLQSYPELQSQYIYCVTKRKKHLGFEFWLKSAKALEQLKLSTENDSLVNALSDFSEKKSLGLDIGLGSQHLCFKCKIDGKQYAQGQAHFMEGSSDSSDESDEADDQQKQSNETQGAASGAEEKDKKVFGEFKKEEMTEKETNQKTSEVKNKASFFEQKITSVISAPAEHAAKANNKEAEQFKVIQLQYSACGSSVDALGSQGHPQTFMTPNASETGDAGTKTSGAIVTQTGSPTDKLLVKNIYLYLPFKSTDILRAFIESNSQELHGKHLQPVTESKELWEVQVHLHPEVLDKQIVYQFGVEKVQGFFSHSQTIIKDRVMHTMDSSSIERKFGTALVPVDFYIMQNT